MPTESFRISATFPATPERLYRAWLDSHEHSAFTGGAADIQPSVGGAHSSWDGYIWGRFLELDPNRRIVATWRTSEFPPGTEDSRVEITFEREGRGTRVTIAHTEIPEGHGGRYETGWEDFYFDPMRRHFATPVAVVRASGDGSKGPRVRATEAATGAKSRLRLTPKTKPKAKPKTKPKTKARVVAKAKPRPKPKSSVRRAKTKPVRGKARQASGRRGPKRVTRSRGR